MHVEIIEVVLVRRSVFTRGQPAQAFLVEENAQGVNAAEQNVDAQVEFQLVDQEWLVEVSLDHVVLVWVKVLKVSRQEDAPALRCRLWLRDESLAIRFPPLLCLIAKLLLEFAELCWQQPRLREELVVFGVDVLHAL